MESIIQDPNVQELIREWEDKGHTEGLAEGRARQARSMLICVLAARSLPISRAVRSRIDREADLGQLEAWITAASTATTVAQVFENG